MMNTVLKKYNDNACDVFDGNHIMSFCTAKHFIDDAYVKRALVRDMIKEIRKSKRSICACWRAYRKAQKLSVMAYKKCLADIERG